MCARARGYRKNIDMHCADILCSSLWRMRFHVFRAIRWPVLGNNSEKSSRLMAAEYFRGAV